MVLKTELHTHTSDDPSDFIPYDGRALIDRAVELGYQVLAITLHDRQLDVTRLAGYAQERGVTLIRGVERTLRGKHVLLLNFPAGAETVTDFDEIRRLKRRSNGLVIAPHPFFPAGSCLGHVLDRYPDVFDAVEINAFYTAALDFNAGGRRWAAAHHKPLVGNGDVHRLRQLGTTFSLVDAERDPDAVCDAIRRGRVRVETRPLPAVTAATLLSSLVVGDLAQRVWSRRSDPVPSVA